MAMLINDEHALRSILTTCRLSARATNKVIDEEGIDTLEELCTGAASRVVVNSSFTASVYQESFPMLRIACKAGLNSPPQVLYPSIDLQRNPALTWPASRGELTLVSLNRFERKKELGLAVNALRELRWASTPDLHSP